MIFRRTVLLFLALFFLFSWKVTLAYDIVNPGGLQFSHDVLGRGFILHDDDYNIEFIDRLKDRCVSGEIVEYGGSFSRLELLKSWGSEISKDLINIGGSTKINFWIAKAKASIRYLMSEASSVSKESEALLVEYHGPSYRYVVDEGVTSLLSGDCGDGILVSISQESKHILTGSIEFFSKEKKEEFNAKVKISLLGGLVKKTLKYKDSNSDYLEGAVVVVSHYYEGVTTDDLTRIRDFSTSPVKRYRCDISNFDVCADKYEEISNYLGSEEFIDSLKNSYVTGNNEYIFAPYYLMGYDYTDERDGALYEKYMILIEYGNQLSTLYSDRERMINKLVVVSTDLEKDQLHGLISSLDQEIRNLEIKIENCSYDDLFCS